MVEAIDSGKFDGNDKWRCVGTRRGLIGERKFFAVVGYKHADEENREYIEEDDSEEGELDGAWNRLAGVLCLGDRHTNQLRSEEGEYCSASCRPEPQESSSSTSVFVLGEGSGVAPVSKTGGITVRTASTNED